MRRGKVLVRVHAIALNPVDYRLSKILPIPLYGKRLLASDFSGHVLEVGAGVSHVEVGDSVYGMVSALVGGVSADRIVVSAQSVAKAPSNIPLEEAAAVPLAAMTCLQSFRNLAKVSEGQSVFINGASGGVGTFGVQIACILGAEVTGVCSERNREMVESLGAVSVLDYARDDIFNPGKKFDVVYDARGNISKKECIALAVETGTVVTTEVTIGGILSSFLNPFRGVKEYAVAVRSSRKDLGILAEWIEKGMLKPVVERVYSRRDIREAYLHLRSRRARGKLVVRWDSGDCPED